MQFRDLKLNPSILKAIEDQKYETPTPIQEKAIPAILEGRDILGCAQTGTGKTAAFAMPILNILSKELNDSDDFPQIQALVLAPTRELAIQIGESFTTYGQHLSVQTGVIYGGITPKRHIKVLKRGIHILVATPGRLLDLMEQGYVDLNHVKMLVIDEADRMLDLGMIKDVKTILAELPKARQNMLFSATMPKEITNLTQAILKNPIRIEMKARTSHKTDIVQRVYYVDEPDKTALLLHLLKDPAFESVLVFVRTKGKADRVCKAINVTNIRTKAIHGDKNQSERLQALELFKNKEIRILVATDVAARGIDIERLTHVVNMDIPNVPETYIHRIGRTGRAGLGGTAISFCSNQERPFLTEIEKLQGKAIPVVDGHPFVLMNVAIERNREKYATTTKEGQKKGVPRVKKGQ